MKKNVIILCPYSAPSACGIWKRVSDDANALIANGYDVIVYSSNRIKGTNEFSSKEQVLAGITFKRFKVWFSMGGTSMFWFPIRSLIRSKADIIHTHGYRHPHSILALIIGKCMRKKVILTTHGPFEKDSRRSILLKLFDIAYDLFVGWWELNLYNEVIKVANWETEHLKKRLLSEKKQVLIPNGIDSAFTSIQYPISSIREHNTTEKAQRTRRNKSKYNSLFFMGRVDPVKQLEWVQYAAKQLPQYHFDIIGPLHGYDSLKSESRNLEIDLKTFSKEEFIQEAQKHDIYLFPSIRESFGMTCLEAMSQGSIIIANKTKGVLEYLKDGKNGFLVSSREEMGEKIQYVYEHWEEMEEVRGNAIKTAEEYSNNRSGKLLIELYEKM